MHVFRLALERNALLVLDFIFGMAGQRLACPEFALLDGARVRRCGYRPLKFELLNDRFHSQILAFIRVHPIARQCSNRVDLI